MARRLGTIMVDMGYLDEDGLWQVLEEQKKSGGELIGRVAIRIGRVNEDQVLKALGEQLGMKVIKLADLTVPAEVMELVNETMAQAFKVVPIAQGKKDKSVTVAMAEPQNHEERQPCPASYQGQPRSHLLGRGPLFCFRSGRGVRRLYGGLTLSGAEPLRGNWPKD